LLLVQVLDTNPAVIGLFTFSFKMFFIFCKYFFNHLRTKLSDANTEQLVIGSDEEQSLVNAITIKPFHKAVTSYAHGIFCQMQNRN
jgi:hypothetical protein